MSEKVYLNGEILESANATVSAWNPALLQGVGLFETLRSYDGRPFRLEQHIERLQNSAAKFKMPVAEVIGFIPEAIRAVLDENKLSDARIRFTITPAIPPGATTVSAVSSSLLTEQWHTAMPTLLVTAQPLTGYSPELYEKGMTVFICTDYRQSAHDPLTGHKTTSYFPRLIALREAHERGCGEAIWFTPQNLLAEGSISNVFLIKDGTLRTPPLDTAILPGITRAAVLELARDLAIPCEERPCQIDDLLDADEVFLTNSIMEVMPVTRVERRSIANEKPGSITQQLSIAYRQSTRTD